MDPTYTDVYYAQVTSICPICEGQVTAGMDQVRSVNGMQVHVPTCTFRIPGLPEGGATARFAEWRAELGVTD